MTKLISKSVIEDIRLQNDVVDVIGSYLPLKRAGSAFKALCPFHKEKTPSFSVNPQRQIYHCFGCGAGGDVSEASALRTKTRRIRPISDGEGSGSGIDGVSVGGVGIGDPHTR